MILDLLTPTPLGFPAAVGGLFLSLAVPVLRAGEQLAAAAVQRLPLVRSAWSYDWTVKARLGYAKWRLARRGWRSRHALRSDILVDAVEAGTITVAELEQIAPRVATENVGLKLSEQEPTEAEKAEVDTMRDTVAGIGETFTFTEATRAARRAALQADTILIPVVKLEEVDAMVRSRTEAADVFAAAYAKDDLEFATALGVFLNDNDLLVAELAVARMYRGWSPSQSGEYPIVDTAEAVAGR